MAEDYSHCRGSLPLRLRIGYIASDLAIKNVPNKRSDSVKPEMGKRLAMLHHSCLEISYNTSAVDDSRDVNQTIFHQTQNHLL